MEAQFVSQPGAPLVLIGQPNAAEKKIDNPLIVPKALSFLTYRRWSAEVLGLDAFPPELWPENVGLLYFSYHIMVGLGTIFIAIMVVSAFLLWRGKLFTARWMLWILEVVFSVSSALLAIFFGAALGNVIRGVPLGPDGYFFEPLWTNFSSGPNPGILDWYTVMAGVVALVTLASHGALYVAVKTEGDLGARGRKIAITLWPVQLVLTSVSLLATYVVRPGVLQNFLQHPVGLLVPITVLASLLLMIRAARRGQDKQAFIASSLYIAAMLVGAAFALYPVVLSASTDPSYSLTIYNSAAGHHGLAVGLTWWVIGMVLALGYFFFIYRMFRGKVRLEEEGY
jgi:cytochrome bd ubiquinol oxidase subunit II